MAHLFLDQEPDRPSPYTQTTRSATFIEQYEPGWGQVRVEDGDATSLVDVRLLPGVYAKGAQVGVVCGHDGRPIHATPPHTMADDAMPIGVGASGEYAIEAKTEAGEAKKDAADALSEARKAWDEASAARESIVEVDTSAKAAQAAAHNAEIAAQLTQQALDAATEAQELENARLEGLAVDADAKADAARARADELAEQAQDAMTAAQQAQTSADGKALVAYSDYQPATIAGQKIIWFKPGSVPMLFDGEEWRSVQPGDGVVEALDIGTATVGELSGMRIKAGTASVDILIPGENARWTSSGLTIYHPLTPEQQQAGIEPTDWDKRAIALNLTSDGARFISVADEAGTVTAYMSPQGEVSGRELTITGAANVDTLQVGGLSLEEIIAVKSNPAIVVPLPRLTHPSGFDSIIVAETDWLDLEPGFYNVSWPAHIIATRGGSYQDAAGGYLELEYRDKTSGATGVKQWHAGDTRMPGWTHLPSGVGYFLSHPSGVFEARDDYEYKINIGMHSYSKWKLESYSSVLTVSKLHDSTLSNYTLISQPAPPAPPPPKRVTASVGLSNIWYAYGSKFAQSSSYQSGGTFRIPGAKGKQIISIRVTGRCNFDFMDGGAGASFSFYLGGENRTVVVHDYGPVDLGYGPTAGATLSRDGAVAFRLNKGAPTYNEYNPGSFRCTVTYQ